MSYSTTQRAIRFILFGLAAVPLFAIVFLFASSNMASELVTCVRDGQSTKQAITIKFDEIPALEDWSHEGDQAWNRLLRPGKGGFLLIQKNVTDAVPWGISMYHGLHCLKMIRDMMAKAKTTEISNNIHDHSGFEEEHLGHCFAYLAQSLLCAADDTIEPPFELKNSAGQVTQTGVDGMGYTHQCRDASPILNAIKRAEEEPIDSWGWKIGDTVENVFG